MNMPLISFFIVLSISFTVGMVVGMNAGSFSMREDAFMHGAMVECIGKSGYFWECE